MYSSDLLQKAIDLAYTKHQGQVDKAGQAYIKHPERVASKVNTIPEKIVAWLHDVVEDTDYTLEMAKVDFGEEISDALDHVTHRPGESYFDYVKRASMNPIAKAVKISDLIDNSNLSRLSQITMKDIQRQKKYNESLSFLMG